MIVFGWPCGRALEEGNYWHYCGETDMEPGVPILCEECYQKLVDAGYDVEMYGEPIPLKKD